MNNKFGKTSVRMAHKVNFSQTLLKSNWKNAVKVLLYISKLRYMDHAYAFILYMVVNFYKVNRRKYTFLLRKINTRSFCKLIKLSNSDVTKIYDINNTVVINDSFLFEGEKFVKLYSWAENLFFERIVFVIGSKLCPVDSVIINDVLKYNMKKVSEINEIKIQSIKQRKVTFADEINISIINNPTIDLSNAAIDTILRNYFALPKLMSQGDVIEICLDTYGKEVYYSNTNNNRMNNPYQTIHFKCNKILSYNHQVYREWLCSSKETSVTQSASTKSFLPSYSQDYFECPEDNFKATSICPYGLECYFEEMKKSVKPFLSKKKLHFNPVFLLEGPKGVGKNTLLSTLASDLGMHHFKIHSIELTANVYAQNETKLRNFFYMTKTSAPCLMVISDFENFGKNNEGEYDERIIGNFATELMLLFENNALPVILFCCSNRKDIPAQLRRQFLQVFEMKAPNESQRESLIKYCLESSNIKYDFNLKDIASQTNGFLYEDLLALTIGSYIQYARRTQSENPKEVATVEKCDMLKSLDEMQSKFSESLGAPKVPKVLWGDIGGLEEVKKEIIKTINLPLKHPELVKQTGLKRSGILLYGPPGTGKTLLAKAIATECGLCFLSVKGPELLNMYIGQSEQNVREVFERARQASPCIIFFDELDSLAPNRGKSGDSGGVMDRVVSQLLAEMDGLNESATIFTIGATNRPDLIDPALLRPGRFDKLLYVGPCTDKKSKLSVLKALTGKFILAKDTNLNKIVDITPPNITGADFYGICGAAWTSAARKLIEKGGDLNSLSHENVVVDMEDFKSAIAVVKPSLSREDLLYFDKLKQELSLNNT